MLKLAVIVALVYLGLCALLFIFQRSLIYFPHPRSPGSGTAHYTLAVDGAELLVTTRAHAGTNAVVYFGGNAEDVSQSLPDLVAAYPDHALHLLHYRGYGGSTGRPTEAALFADALALFDKVRSQHPTVTVVGRSLGSGVAVHVASRRPVARLVLVTPYDSVQAIAAARFRLFPVRWLLSDKFESWRDAPQVGAPTLLIAAEHDEVIPRASTESLLARFRGGVAAMQVIAGTSHNTVSDTPEYVALLKGTR